MSDKHRAHCGRYSTYYLLTMIYRLDGEKKFAKRIMESYVNYEIKDLYRRVYNECIALKTIYIKLAKSIGDAINV